MGDKFIGSTVAQQQQMLETVVRHLSLKDVFTPDDLYNVVVPVSQQFDGKLSTLDGAMSQEEALTHIKKLGSKNKVFDPAQMFAGAGYYQRIIPKLLQDIVTNMDWVTPYTPYQAEVSQGLLRAGHASASMWAEFLQMKTVTTVYHGPHALAEAALMAVRLKKRNKVLVSESLNPAARENVETYLREEGLEVVTIPSSRGLTTAEGIERLVDSLTAAVIVQTPNFFGFIDGNKAQADAAHSKGALYVVYGGGDQVSLITHAPPGSYKADIFAGEGQSMGLRLASGGPHFGIIAVPDDEPRGELVRQLPGRIFGSVTDDSGRTGYVLVLQTREQHIVREQATSNICTSQAWMAMQSLVYALLKGPEGLKRVASESFNKAHYIARQVQSMRGVELLHPEILDSSGPDFFNEFGLRTNGSATGIIAELARYGVLGGVSVASAFPKSFTGKNDDVMLVAATEANTAAGIDELLTRLEHVASKGLSRTKFEPQGSAEIPSVPKTQQRSSLYVPALSPEAVKNMFDEWADLNTSVYSALRLDGLFPLGSCTMIPTADGLLEAAGPFLGVHPYQHLSTLQGVLEMQHNLESILSEEMGGVGWAATLQPSAGAQAEFAGLLAIKGYQKSRGESEKRKYVIIPDSAHGTNPASAARAGFKLENIITLPSKEDGRLDYDALKSLMEGNEVEVIINGVHKKVKQKIRISGDEVSAFMATFPGTRGLPEPQIKATTELMHKYGVQVFCDGANSIALVGRVRMEGIGADVIHLNLHKTFDVPHCGGGPGAGVTVVAPHLTKFLPGPTIVKKDGEFQFDYSNETATGMLSSSPFGHVANHALAYDYILRRGAEGFRESSAVSVLHGNYMHCLLDSLVDENGVQISPAKYPGPVAHEGIVSDRYLKNLKVIIDGTEKTLNWMMVMKGVISKRFYASTVGFPEHDGILTEPTDGSSPTGMIAYSQEILDTVMNIRADPNWLVKKYGGEGRMLIQVTKLETKANTQPVLAAKTWV